MDQLITAKGVLMRGFLPTILGAVSIVGCVGWGSEHLDIRDVQWQVVKIGGKPVAATDRPASMLLAIQGHASGSGGCNQWAAQYSLKGTALSFRQMSSTRVGCQGPVGDGERTYFAILRAVDRYSRGPGNSVTLSTPQGQTITFEAVGRGS